MLLTSTDHLEVAAGMIEAWFAVAPTVVRVGDPFSITKLVALADAGEDAKLVQVVRDVTLDIDVAGVGVEMQVRRDLTFLPRSLSYLVDIYQKGYGGDHGKVRPAWSMNVLAHILFPNDAEPLRVWDLPPAGSGYAPLLRWGFFELGKPATGLLGAVGHLLTTGTARRGDPKFVHQAAAMIEYMNASTDAARVMSRIALHEKTQAVEIAAREHDC